MQNKKQHMGNARDHEEQEYIIGIHFCPYNMEKKKRTKFENIWFPTNFELNL
jgi:hypothetical protein